MIVKSFRGKKIPSSIQNKSKLIEYVLLTERENEPISNGEFVFDLRCTRFGGVLHDMRKEGYDIVTLPAKDKGHFLYYLVSTPSEKLATSKVT
tara:strand:+ start:945 stop:1223 length:279 start_codon:yes stop_codon:yes gene_type:complete